MPEYIHIAVCVCAVVLCTRRQMWVVVLPTLWTRLSTVVTVSRRASCLMLAFNVASICGTCLQVSQLSTSKDERTYLVTVSCVPRGAPLDSQLDVDINPCRLCRHCVMCWLLCVVDSDHWPRKPGKVRELSNCEGKWEKSRETVISFCRHVMANTLDNEMEF